MHQLPRGDLPRHRGIHELHELPRGHLLGRGRGDLVDAVPELHRWSVLGPRGRGVHGVCRGLISGGHGGDTMRRLPRWKLLCKRWPHRRHRGMRSGDLLFCCGFYLWQLRSQLLLDRFGERVLGLRRWLLRLQRRERVQHFLPRRPIHCRHLMRLMRCGHLLGRCQRP